MAKQQFYILPLLWLGLLSSPLLYAANDCPKDSLITYNQYKEPTAKTIYLYDEVLRLIENAKYIYKDTIWMGDERTTYVYFDDGKIKEKATWTWDLSAQNWIGDEKYIYEYNNKGLTTIEEKYVWGTDDWVCSTKKEYQYDDANRKILEVTYSGSGTQWIPSTKKEMLYDAKGNTLLSRYWEQYDSVNKKWIGSSWAIFEYNCVSQPTFATLDERYTWKDGDWYGSSKVESNYNSLGKLIYQCSYQYNEVSKSWDYLRKYIFDFDNNENQTLIEQYQWEADSALPEKGYWKGIVKEEYAFDEDNNPTLTTYYQWDDATRHFIGISKSRIEYDVWENIIYEERYNWKTDESLTEGGYWRGLKQEEHTYINTNLLIEETIYQWDDTNKEFIGNTHSLYAFDERKNKILNEQYTWNQSGNYWQGITKDSTTYNDKNKETDKITYQWDDTNRRWLGSSKSIYEFDAANHLILEEQYTWNLDPSIPEGGTWHGTKKEEFGYNAANQQIKAIIYAWSETIDSWIGQTMKLSNFDNYKNQTLNEQYTWEVEATETGGYWKGSEKATYTFNKNKQQTSSWVYSWDDTNRQWIYASRDTSSYDNKKNLTLDERYTYDVTNQAWVGTLKKEYAYNTKGQQTMFAYYAWDETISKFIGTQKEENEMDDAGRTILHASYTWGTDTWKGKSKDTYTYFRKDTIADHITFTWKSSKWTESKKTTDSYSDAGQHTATANFTWNTTSQSWLGVKQTKWEYTTTGKVATEIVSTWGTTDWVNSTKLENTYTAEVLTAYVNSKWESNAWLYVSKWEQTDPNTDCTFEWWNSDWSKTQENKKTYDGENRLILESKQNWQQGVPTAGSKSVYVYTGSHMTLQSDSVYSISLTQWLETKRVTNAYDANDQQTLAMTQVFENGTQTSGDKTTHTYNGEGLQTNITISTWAGSDWLYVSKVDNAYEGKSVTTTSYVWDNTKPEWQGVEKDEKIYSNDLDYTSTKSEWRNGGWFGISKTGYTYYVDGREYTIVDYLWSSSTWVEDFKTEYAYSGANNKVTATYTYQDKMWVGQTKEGVYYDEYEDLTTATWTWKNNAWSPQSKSGQSLLDDGRIKSKTSYKIAGSDFVFTTRVEYEYGATAKDITTANYTWDGSAWKGVSKSGEVWDGSKISSQITYTWTGGFTWQYNQKTEYEYGDQSKDLTTAIYTWNNTIPDWVGVSKSGETYASNGKQASEFSYVWGAVDSVTTDWLPVSKTEWEYGEGKNNSVANYVGKDTSWVGIKKISETYTETGDPLSIYTYCWKNSTWADSLKKEYAYNEYGDVIQYIDAQWQSGTWKNLTTSTQWNIQYYDYSTGKILVDEHKVWSTKGWIGSGSKKECKYDDWGHLIFELNAKWKTKDYVNTNKHEWVYSETGITLLNAYYTWDTSKGWKGSYKYEYLYNSNGQQTMNASYSWNTSKWKWEGTTKNEHIFDELGNETATRSYKWDKNKWDWVGKNQTITEYDDAGHLIYKLDQSYNADLDDWQNSTKYEYQYDSDNNVIVSNYYTWLVDRWILRIEKKNIYDQDANYKQRIEHNAIYSTTGEVQSYGQVTYYYHCDPKFTITVNTKEDGVGEVSGGGIYTYYARPQISAIETPNCNIFNQWTDGETSDKRRILVIEDKTYTAEFTSIEHTITTTVKDNRGGSAIISK